jgi:hypothetical protein
MNTIRVVGIDIAKSVFQATEEPFHWAVIPAVFPATQALLYLISLR